MKIAARYAAATILAGASMAAADAVDPGNIVTFQAGDPAIAAEVNGNFAELISAINDNDARIALLEAPASPVQGVQEVVVDCVEDPEALAAAIEESGNDLALEVTVSGQCAPISVERDNVTITGPATVVAGPEGELPVTVVGARNLVLEDLTLDASGLATQALMIHSQASVTAMGLTVTGATVDQVLVVHSGLMLRGENLVAATGSPARGFNAVSAYLRVQDGTTSISTGELCGIWLEAHSLWDATVGTTVLEGCLLASSSSMAGLVNDDITGDVLVTTSSTVWILATGGRSVSVIGDLTVASNATLHLNATPTSSVTASGIVGVLAHGFLVLGNVDPAGAGSVSAATAPGDYLYVRNGEVQLAPGGLLEADQAIAEAGAAIFVDGGNANTQFTLTMNSTLLDRSATPSIEAADVICVVNAVAQYADSNGYQDLCAN